MIYFIHYSGERAVKFRYGVAAFLDECNGIHSEEGWPWPWADSDDTDYVYAFDGRVWVARDGHGWLTREGAINDLWEDTEPVVFYGRPGE